MNFLSRPMIYVDFPSKAFNLVRIRLFGVWDFYLAFINKEIFSSYSKHRAKGLQVNAQWRRQSTCKTDNRIFYSFVFALFPLQVAGLWEIHRANCIKQIFLCFVCPDLQPSNFAFYHLRREVHQNPIHSNQCDTSYMEYLASVQQ